jgi:hypothetical protein
VLRLVAEAYLAATRATPGTRSAMTRRALNGFRDRRVAALGILNRDEPELQSIP